jgi:cysteinyl-tRNA synthetase
MVLQIYNTLTHKKEHFETLHPGQVDIYVCGLTVYDKAHVGHARSILVFDIIRSYLDYRGYKVRYVMNFTDVDDKIIQRAKEQGVDALELAERYIRDFQKHLDDLNVQPASV